MDRRTFLRGVLSISAVAVTGLPAIANEKVPTIFGDGDRDDWAGLQAMIDGKPFRVDGEIVRVSGADRFWNVEGGNFVLSRGLVIRGDRYFRFVAEHLRLTSDFPHDEAVFTASGWGTNLAAGLTSITPENPPCRHLVWAKGNSHVQWLTRYLNGRDILAGIVPSPA